MSALESLISSGGEANLADSLSFDLPPASTAVVDRKQGCRAYPSSASTLSWSGTKTCRIRLGGNDFCNPESVRLQFQINNTSTSPLYPASGPHGIWAQVRLLSGGVEVDNIGCYARHHDLHGLQLCTGEQQWTEAIYGTGGSFNRVPMATNFATNRPDQGAIGPGGNAIVSHKLLLSLFTAGKMLPLRYAPLELELTLGPASDYVHPTRVGSTQYNISDVQLMYDASVLDESVQESFYKALLSNRVLNIPCQQFHQVVLNLNPGSTSFTGNIVRSFSRLSKVWITFRNEASPRVNSFLCPTDSSTGFENDDDNFPIMMHDDAPSIRLSCGAKYWPDFQPVSTYQEHFHMLMKALPFTPLIDRSEFCGNMFVSAFDLQRTPGDPTSAISTRSSDQLRIEVKNLTPGLATEMWVTLWAFGVCAVRESGITMLD